MRMTESDFRFMAKEYGDLLDAYPSLPAKEKVKNIERQRAINRMMLDADYEVEAGTRKLVKISK